MAKTDLKGSSFRDFLRIIFSRKSIILATFMGVTFLVLVVSLLTPPIYESSTKLIAKERKTENVLESKFYFDYRTERVAFLQSQMEIIQSDEVARRVLSKLMPSKSSISLQDIRSFLPKVKVASPKNYDLTSSDVLFIYVSDNNPVRAAEEANLLTDEYISYTFELKGKSAKNTVVFLEKQSQVSLDKMKGAEELLKKFEGKSGPELAFLIATAKSKGPNTELISYNSNYISAKAGLLEAEIYLKQLKALMQKGALPNKVVRENPVLVTIKDNIAKLETQLANLRSQYTDLFPKNKSLLLEIEVNKKLLKREIEADLSGRNVDVIALEARVKAMKETVDQYTSLAQKQLEYSRVYRSYEMLEEDYQNLLRDIQKAKTAEAMETYKLANIEIIDRAKIPKNPISPNIFANVLIGGLVGLLLGLGLAFVTDYFDHTLKSVEDVERHLNISVIGSIPRQ